MRTFGVPDALTNLRPESQWSLVGDEYENINWMDPNNEIPTKEEIQAEIDRLNSTYPLEFCKYEAKRRIAETDWAVLPDVNLLNRGDFEDYRAVLRQLILFPVADPTWPIMPEPIWE